MKEAFRLNAGGVLGDVVNYNFVFVYFGSDKVSFVQVEECVKSLLLSMKMIATPPLGHGQSDEHPPHGHGRSDEHPLTIGCRCFC